MSPETKPPPPIRIKRRPAPSPESVVPPELNPGPVPAGPARVRLNRRNRDSSVNVTLAPWSSPFRITEADPNDRRGPCGITWGPRGAGTLRTCPPDFEPISCATRREAQELILILYRDWLIDPARASLLQRVRAELRGKVLGCHCGPGTPCHGDVLLELANHGAESARP